MCADIVDNRKKDYAVDNRQRYIDKENRSIRQAVRKKLKEIGIKELGKGQDVDVTVEKSNREVDLGYDPQSGKREAVGTGNTENAVGDRQRMPSGGEGRGGEGSPDAEDEDAEFTFRMTAEEFMNMFFDELSLPFLVKKMMTEEDSNSFRRAGYVTDGSPSRLSIVKTYKNSLGRSISEKQDYLDQIDATDDEEEKAVLEEKINSIPLFRDVDLRFTNWVPEPIIKYRSVMFCIMDVSGSMMEDQRFLAKQFFLMLYVFLKKCYTSVDVVFIRHTTQAEEVDEETFFYKDLSGGTVLSSGLVKANEIIQQRYANQNYNIYITQVSDGDNWGEDDAKIIALLRESILPQVQYYVYAETPDMDGWGGQNAITFGTKFYKAVTDTFKKDQNFSSVIIRRPGEIFKAFLKLFVKKGVQYE